MSRKHSFGILLKSKRIMKNLSESELALLLAVPRAVLRRWESGRSTPNSEHTLGICRILDITEQELQLAESGRITDEYFASQIAPAQKDTTEKAGAGYTACKWIFFGVFLSLTLFLAYVCTKYLSVIWSAGFFENLYNAYSKGTSSSYIGLSSHFSVLLLIVAALAIFSFIALRKTKKGPVVPNRKAYPLAIIGSALLLIGSVLLAGYYLNRGGVLAESYNILPTYASCIGFLGMLICIILKKQRIAACFALLPLLRAIHTFVPIFDLLPLDKYFLAFGLDLYLPYLLEAVFLCLFIIKSFVKKATLRTPLVLLTAAFLCYASYGVYRCLSISLSSSILSYYNAPWYLGMALLCASQISLKRSFVTDALHGLSKPLPFIAGSMVASIIVIIIFNNNGSGLHWLPLLLLLAWIISYPIVYVFLFSFLLFPNPHKARKKAKGKNITTEVKNEQ